MVDLANDNTYIPLDITLAWNWQQGTMLQWLGSFPESQIIYNSVDGQRYISIVRDVQSGETRHLPKSIYAVSRDGHQAVTLDYERVNTFRPGYGYMAVSDFGMDNPAPEDVGIYWMDVRTGHNNKIVDLAWAASHRRDQRFANGYHWFNHLSFNPSGTRFLFLHRWRDLKSDLPPGPPTYSGRWTRLYTANPDGTDVRMLSDAGMVSHFDWKDDHTILAWTVTKEQGEHFYLIDETTGAHQIVGAGILTQDGHCSYSPSRRWILNDTYPNEQNEQTLMLFDTERQRRFDLAELHHSPALKNEPYRCDLHPRWNRDGTQVCVDSVFEGSRQVYILDVSRYVGHGS